MSKLDHGLANIWNDEFLSSRLEHSAASDERIGMVNGDEPRPLGFM
jgi:hypothetical protein